MRQVLLVHTFCGTDLIHSGKLPDPECHVHIWKKPDHKKGTNTSCHVTRTPQKEGFTFWVSTSATKQAGRPAIVMV